MVVSEEWQKIIEKMSEAYWNAGPGGYRWHSETEEVKRQVRWQMKCALKTFAKEYPGVLK